MSDKQFNDAIESGKRNLESIKLINNWCKNAQVIKTGGTGLIEIQTGLPIGHHGIRCEHAPEGGFSTWHVADAIPDFYDKNCQTCTKRIPVGLPNILQVIGIRDARKEKYRLESEALETTRQLAYAKRKERRILLSNSLSAVSASIIDHIDELDRLRTRESVESFFTTAKIAPHAFTQEIIEYCFKLIEEGEVWFYEAGLQALNELSANKVRLIACAMKCISSSGHNELAVSLVTQNPMLCQKDLIEKIMTSLIHLASHDRSLIESYQRKLDKKPLQEVYKANSDSVCLYLQKAFNSRNIGTISFASRAIKVLSEVDPTIAPKFSRDLISKLLRAELLLDDIDSERAEEFHDIVNAIVCAFNSEPKATDELLTGFIFGTNPESEKRLFRVYRNVLDQLNSRNAKESKPIIESHRIAFNRMIWGAAKGNNFDLHTEASHFLSHPSEPVKKLASENIDAMFGCALLLNEQIRALENVKKNQDGNFLDYMEFQNNLSSLRNFRNNLIACAIASIELTGNYNTLFTFLEGLPETETDIYGEIVSNLHMLTKTVSGLNVVLPYFYTALVGPSSLIRASAAQAFSEISYNRREDIPDIAREAFLALLSDPFVIVHKYAVRALSRAHMPTEFIESAKMPLASLIHYYGQQREPDSFAIECIELYIEKFCDLKTLEGEMGDYFISLLLKQKPYDVAKDISFWARRLGKCSTFISLLKVIFNDPESISTYYEEKIFDIVQELDTEFIQKNILSLLELAEAQVKKNPYHLTNFIEPFTVAKEWSAATQLTSTTLASIPISVRTAHQRLFISQWDVTSKFEYKIYSNDFSQLDEVATEWEKISNELHKDVVNDRNNFPFDSLFSED